MKFTQSPSVLLMMCATSLASGCLAQEVSHRDTPFANDMGVDASAQDLGADAMMMDMRVDASMSDMMDLCGGNDPCSNGGVCFVPEGKTAPECRECDEGYEGYESGPGNFCTTCAQGYFALPDGECVVEPTCAPACEGIRVCRQIGQKGPQCVCPPGQQDVNNDGQCNPTCEDVFPEQECGGRGVCSISGVTGVPTGGKVQCACDLGYESSVAVGGLDCDVCQSTYVRLESECVLREECLPGTCSVRGECADDTGVTVCSCFEGYVGDDCGTCAPNYVKDESVMKFTCILSAACMGVVCEENSSCEGATGECLCDEGFVKDSMELCVST